MNSRIVFASLALLVLLGAVVGAVIVERTPSAVPAQAAAETPAAAPQAAGPNVLMIVWDTVRADRMSLYGHSRQTTPRIDAWARDAVVFERAISPGIWTPPSHASLFTGIVPRHHGVKATYKWLDGHHLTLAERLRDAGWNTWAFSANPYVAPTSNLLQGFQVIGNTFSQPWKKAAREATMAKLIPRDASTDMSPAWKGNQKVIGDVHPYKDAGPVAHEALVRWLSDRPSDAPWFAFINMMEAHIPRVPSMASRKALLDDELIELGLKTPVSQIDLLAYTFGKKEFSDAELAAIRGVYDAALRDLDNATADLLDELRTQGRLDNTIVVLTADHGENLGDHHMFGHKYSVWDTLARVPLIISWPTKLGARRVQRPVSNLSVYATLLDLVGLAPSDPGPDVSTNLFADGDATPLFTELAESTPVAIRRIDQKYGIDDKAKWLRRWEALELDGWKLIRAGDGEQHLYNLAKDPGETEDRVGQDPERAKFLTEALGEWTRTIPPYDPSKRTDRDAPEPIDKATKRMLEELGYLEEAH